MLKNYTYTGNLLLQKTFRENHITKKTVKNRGELPMYHAAETHEAIIDEGTFMAVQAEMKRRMNRQEESTLPQKPYPFTHKMICDCCGAYYRRKITRDKVLWVCSVFNQKGKEFCTRSKAIPQDTLISLCNDVLGLSEFDESVFEKKVVHIRICDNNTVRFILANGSTVERVWKDRSRAESWTPEKKELARQRTLKRYESKEVE